MLDGAKLQTSRIIEAKRFYGEVLGSPRHDIRPRRASAESIAGTLNNAKRTHSGGFCGVRRASDRCAPRRTRNPVRALPRFPS